MDLPRIFKIALAIVGGLFALLLTVGFIQLWSMSHKGYAFADHDLASHLTGPPHAADTGWSATYDLLELKPSRLRGAIRGEKRLTDNGKPVVWDLVMFSPDEYHWQRTDWDPWGYTPAIVRCGAAGRDTTSGTHD